MASTYSSFEFTDQYLADLRARVPLVANHFAVYFGELLDIKLRPRLRCPYSVDDARQETLVRVLEALQVKGRVRNAKSLGAFVNSVCNNVLLENWRKRNRLVYGEVLDFPDHRVNLEGDFAVRECKQRVKRSLSRLPKRDRELIQSAFYDETPRPEVCRRLDIDSKNVRVVIHRAIGRLRSDLLEPQAA